MAKSAKINFDSQVRTLSLKFYVEQLMPAKDRQYYETLLANCSQQKYPKLIEKAKKMEQFYCKKFFDLVNNFSYKDFCVAAIYHDKDTTEKKGSPFLPSAKKGHWHLLIWRKNWRAPKARFRVKTIINQLGLNYAPQLDSQLWLKHGAEVIQSSVANYMAYLPHETETAIAQGKHQYSRKEIAKNFSDDELEKIFKYYEKMRKKTTIDWDELDRQAIQRGLQVKDFDNWIRSKLNVSQRASSNYTVVHKDYEFALSQGVKEMGNITRCSILISGAGNLGKTYTTSKTLKAMGLSVCEAADGSGKYDTLKATDQALVFNDTGVSDAKKVFDNCAVVLHRRNSDDRPWTGKYAIVTTNYSPFDAVHQMIKQTGYATRYEELNDADKTSFDAVAQRLYFCHIDPETKLLVRDKSQERGSQDSYDKHDDMFVAFQNEFNIQLQTYEYKKPISKLDVDNEKHKNDWKLTPQEFAKKYSSKRANIVQLNQKKEANNGPINPF